MHTLLPALVLFSATCVATLATWFYLGRVGNG